MGQIIYGIATLLRFYSLLIIVWALLSWVPRERGGLLDDLSMTLGGLVEPLLSIIRGFLPPMAGIDFSPVIAILLIDILRSLLLRI